MRAKEKLKSWFWWASPSRIKSFKELGRKNMEFILNTILVGLSNARIESANNKIMLVSGEAMASGTSGPCST